MVTEASESHVIDESGAEASGRGFAVRSYPARVIGLGLGFIAVATALWPQSRDWPLWVFLIAYSFIWPHLAYFYAIRISNTYHTGHRQLMVDAFCGGIWVAAMSFNLLPSVLILTMLGMNNMAAGGLPVYSKGLLMQVLGFFVGVGMFGWEPRWHTSLVEIIACIPFLAIHPLAVGIMAYAFAQRLHEQKKTLKLLSRTDGLTGLYNRRYWQQRAAEEFERCRRTGSSAVLLMLDLDHFKKINDRYGHSVGDDVLRTFGHLLEMHLRSIDVVGRFGGEEFAAVLLDISTEHAECLAERLRTTVSANEFGSDPPLRCTTSIGIAPITSEMQTVVDWVNAADQALYNAKASGRNAVALG